MEIKNSIQQSSSQYHFEKTKFEISKLMDENTISENLPLTPFENGEKYLDKNYQFMKSFLEQVFGKEFTVNSFNPDKVSVSNFSNTPESKNIQKKDNSPIKQHYSYVEEKQSQFLAMEANITLENGDTLDISLSIKFEQNFSEEKQWMTKNDEIFNDPLLISLNNDNPITNSFFDFNVNASQKQLLYTNENSGYLVFDENNNNTVDDGSELFGPKTNDGYQELSGFDDDKNGWLDDADKIFKQLKLWTITEGENGKLSSLKELGIGALSLTKTSMSFIQKTDSETSTAQFKNASLGITSNYEAISMFQIDLKG